MKEELEKLREENERLRLLVFRDELTGLYNRRYFDELLGAELDRNRRYGHALSLMMADIDGFKGMNDRFGHPTGDRVLREVGRVLRGGVRRCDTVFRLGGDEYTVLLPETTVAGAMVMAERLREAVGSMRVEQDGEVFSVTISVGVAGVEMAESVSSEVLIARCDEALYRAKKNGRDCVVSSGTVLKG